MTHPTRRDTLRQLSALTLAGFGAAGAAHAQSDRPIRIVLPVATASGVDTITRAAQGALSKALGHPVMVENQPGAGGILGTTTLVKSAPDGFTLSFVSNNHVIYPSVYKSLPFDPINDITPIAIVGSTPLIVVVNPKVPANNARELAALLKAKAGDMTYASSGNGTILHLAAEMFVDEAGATARHIPYKGVGPMLTDLIGGQVQIGVAALPSVQQHIKSGALRAIGTGAAQRLAAAPDIPTMVEQGMPGYQVEGWFGFIGPKGLPAVDVKRLHDAVVVAFAAPEVMEAMAKQGNTISISTPEYAQQFFRSEMAKYAKLVKKAGIELQ
ncbi:tripartite tricarboxylate transporter substrate binding protein [Sphaerotilus sp.]|uniref:Bug family tripartite tricarboxylate transporter substrate binding protein n=1 Tax=Sphaerotilus sp. TaxID=2093942 RepID=UPI00286EA8C7|nr:tripartite tricarboxylate transporter substrate binding protein [Sphaerotilus sp.]